MSHVRQRLSLLALGILAPVLAFGAIALSGAPPASAEFFHPEVVDSEPIDDPNAPTSDPPLVWCQWLEQCA